jgi:hypothetical protein
MPMQIDQQGQAESGKTEIEYSQDHAGLPTNESHPESNNPVERQNTAQKNELLAVIPFFSEEIQIYRPELVH